MIGASGVGKTAYFLYPNLEYACACGMSFFASDTKGDLARNYGAVAEKYYGYHVSVVDLRNPTRSDGYNLMTLINRYMDKALREHSIEAYGKAENMINILAHSIISPKGEESRGQNDYFYKAAEGVVASVLLLLAEFLPPDKDHPTERRHLVSVFILIQQLLAPSGVRGQSYFKQLMDMLKYLTGQLLWKVFAECIAHRRKVRNIIQQPIPKKPPICYIHLNFPVGLPQRRYSEQMLNEYHFYEHNRICAGTAIVMAVVRVQPFIQPLIIHDLFYFPQQMLLWHQRLQIYDDWLMPCIFSPAFHENTPVSSIIAETGAFG